MNPATTDRWLLGATLACSLVAVVVLINVAAASADRRQAISLLVYGAAFVSCGLCSFLYNVLARGSWRLLLRYLDHAAIFLLIAGTYTPFGGGDLRGPLGFSILAWVWGLASIGVLLKLVLLNRYERLSVALYLGLGWFILFAGRQLIAVIPPASLTLLAFGGVVYTAGAITYARDRNPWTAPIWHACVLTGSVAHFLAVVVFVLAPAT